MFLTDREYVQVGKVHSAQGLRGDLFVYIFAEEAAWSEQWTHLFLGNAQDKRPQQKVSIKSFKVHQKQKKRGFVVKVEGVIDRDSAEKFVGQKVYVPESFLVSDEGEEIYLREVLGFQVIDKERGAVGEITGFSGHSMQDILVIKHPSGGSFEVPFVEPLLLEINKKQHEIYMDIPQGLVCGEEL